MFLKYISDIQSPESVLDSIHAHSNPKTPYRNPTMVILSAKRIPLTMMQMGLKKLPPVMMKSSRI